MKSVMSAEEWNEKGLEEFDKGNWSEALSHYTNALKLEKDDTVKGMYYTNRARIYLRLSDYQKMCEDADNALMIYCNNILYHRYQALVALGRFEEAYRDAVIISSDPNNKVIQLVITARLREIIQERRNNENIKISAKVSEMLDLAFDMNARKKKIAMNNLLVLACDETGAEEIFKKEGVSKMVQLVKVDENDEVICSAIRIVAELCKNNISRTESVMKYVGLPWCVEMVNSTSIKRVNASQYCLQNILNTYSSVTNKLDSKPDEALSEAYKCEIDTILLSLSYSITSKTLTGLARDAIIKLIMRNIHYATLDWAKRLVEPRGVQRLMEIASKMEEYNSEPLLNSTSFTRTITSACLAKICENVYYDDEKTFINAIDEFFEDNEIIEDFEDIEDLPDIKSEVSEMLDLAFDVNAREKEREIAMNNLLVLACDETGAKEIFKKEGVSKIVHLVKVEENEEVICRAIRIVAELCKNNISRTESVMKYVGLPWFLEIMSSTSIERVNASQCCLQNILNTYSGVTNKLDSKPDEALSEAYKCEIDTILLCLSYSITSKTLTGLARDAIIKLIMRNIHCATKLDWAKRFVELRGVQRLMEIASKMEEYNSEPLLNITSSTRIITSACLAKIYENVYYDDKKTFINAIDEFIEDKLHSPDKKSKVRVVVAITTLLLGPSDVGNAIVAKEGILQMILVMAGTDDVLQQTVALECIVAAVTRKDKVDAIINQGVNILKKLCQSKDDSIRVRALLGLSKLGSSGDSHSDVTIRPFADGAKLSKACERLLAIYPTKKNMREWAVKGLSYLTFNAKVKEELFEDLRAIFTIMSLAEETADQSVLFDVLTTLVNLCNAYDEQEEPGIIQLIKIVNYFFPEESELDGDDLERLCVLVEANVISEDLVADNQNCKELIVHVFNAICYQLKLREIVISAKYRQKGGTETLLSLALDGTVKGKKLASRVLVHLGLTIRPEIAFLGDLKTKVVQPIVNLLNPECSVVENCQTLTALRNLAKVDDSMREHIFKEGVFQKIEAFVYEGDYLLKLASANLINILILNLEVAIQCFEQDNSRVDYLMLLYKDENQDIKFAAAAALVKLTVANKEACKKVLDSNFWLEFLRFLLTNPSSNRQQMGIIFVLSMIRSMEDFAAKLIETDIIELLRSLNKNDTVRNKNIKELTSIALEAVAERRSEALIVMIRWERDAACRLGQSDLLNYLEKKLWVYERTKNVPLNIYSEFGKILTGR